MFEWTIKTTHFAVNPIRMDSHTNVKQEKEGFFALSQHLCLWCSDWSGQFGCLPVDGRDRVFSAGGENMAAFGNDLNGQSFHLPAFLHL
jgi:hypothetical protein